MNVLDFKITYETYENLNELSLEDKLLCIRAEEALQSSYSPYSKFKVGTAIQLVDGEIVLGGQVIKVNGIKSLLPFVFVEDRLANVT